MADLAYIEKGECGEPELVINIGLMEQEKVMNFLEQDGVPRLPYPLFNFSATVHIVSDAFPSIPNNIVLQVKRCPATKVIRPPISFPDIGPDPLKASGGDRVRLQEKTKERLTEAHCVQQKGVPDQTALVWRIDLSRMMSELISTKAKLRTYEEQENKRKNDGLVSAIARVPHNIKRPAGFPDVAAKHGNNPV